MKILYTKCNVLLTVCFRIISPRWGLYLALINIPTDIVSLYDKRYLKVFDPVGIKYW